MRDISAGGLSLLTNRIVEVSDVLRCELPVQRLPVTIPVLCQVRWIRKNIDGRKHMVGLQFLI